MCLPIGVIFRCGHTWLGWRPCKDAGTTACTIVAEGRPIGSTDWNLHARSHVLILTEFRDWARENFTYVRINHECSAECCKDILENKPEFINKQRKNATKWADGVQKHMNDCVDYFLGGIGMSNSMRLDMGGRQIREGLSLDTTWLTAEGHKRFPLQAVDSYNAQASNGGGLQAFTGTPYQHFLHLRSWVLNDLNNRSSETWRPLASVVADYNASGNADAGLNKDGVESWGMEYIRRVWTKYPDLQRIIIPTPPPNPLSAPMLEGWYKALETLKDQITGAHDRVKLKSLTHQLRMMCQDVQKGPAWTPENENDIRLAADEANQLLLKQEKAVLAAALWRPASASTLTAGAGSEGDALATNIQGSDQNVGERPPAELTDDRGRSKHRDTSHPGKVPSSQGFPSTLTASNTQKSRMKAHDKSYLTESAASRHPEGRKASPSPFRSRSPAQTIDSEKHSVGVVGSMPGVVRRPTHPRPASQTPSSASRQSSSSSSDGYQSAASRPESPEPSLCGLPGQFPIGSGNEISLPIRPAASKTSSRKGKKPGSSLKEQTTS